NNQGTLSAENGSTMNLIGPSLSNSGSVRAGASGTIKLGGDYTQTASGNLSIDLGGLVAGTSFGQLSIAGTATLDGTLNLELVNGFQSAPGDTFDLIKWSSRSGTFTMVNGTNTGNRVLTPTYQPTGLRITTGTP